MHIIMTLALFLALALWARAPHWKQRTRRHRARQRTPRSRLVAIAATMALAAGFSLVAPSPAAAHPHPNRVIVGELQQGSVNVSPPTRLDVLMYPGNLNGVGIGTRCNNMGDTWLGAEQWWGSWWYVCYHVDY